MPEKNKYYLFIDESGDHNLKNYDPTFPVFTLCGLLISKENLKVLSKQFLNLKLKVFGTTDIIFHSVDIRKQRNVFKILKDDNIRKELLEGIEKILGQKDFYQIVSCTILKKELQEFNVRGENEDVYGLCLSYLIERSIFCIDNENPDENGVINIIVERRGKKEDRKLLTYYNGLRNRGTKWIIPTRFQDRVIGFSFQHKADNIIGLQAVDLIAYPITTHILHPERQNLSYKVISKNIFEDKGKLLGQKIIPNEKKAE